VPPLPSPFSLTPSESSAGGSAALPAAAPLNTFSDLVLDTLRMQEALQRALTGSPDAAMAGLLEGSRQTFRVADLRLMIRYDEGSELIDLPPVAALPGVPRWLAGVCNLHGQILPVFDLAAYWGRPAVRLRGRIKQRLLVLGHGAQAAGIYIDNLPRHVVLASLQTEGDQATAPPKLRRHLRAAYVHKDEAYWDVAVAPLLQALEDELRSAADIQQALEGR